MTLGEAVREVFARHPNMADRAVIEYYPDKPYEPQRRVFAYQFMSTDGRNIATYIPDVADASGTGGLTFQPGMDGQGREYGIDRQGTTDISAFKQPLG